MALTKLPGFTLDSTSSFTFANANVTANVSAGNIKTDNLLYANGAAWDLNGSYSNSNVAGYLPTFTGSLGGTLITEAQPNITSVGTLSSLSVTGLTTATGGVKTANIIDVSGTTTIQTKYSGVSGDVGVVGNLVVGTSGSGNITATYLIGNGSQLTGLPAQYSNANVASYLPTYSGLISGTLSTQAQPNITSTGILTDLVISGNLTVGGNTNYINVETLVIEDPVIEQGGGANGDPLTTNDGKDRGSLLHYYTTTPVDAFMGWDNSNGEFAFGSNVSLSSEVVTFNNFGNVRADTFIGTLSGSASTSGTVTANAQPNITSVGTLIDLNVTGNITGAYIIGNGSQLTGLPASYANSNVEAYLPTYTGNLNPSNLVVTTYSNLGLVSNIYISGGSANYILSTDGDGTLFWSPPSTTAVTLDSFTGDGTTSEFTLTVSPANVNMITVNYNGSVLLKDSYSIAGNVLTLGSAPFTGAKIEVISITNLTGAGGGSSGTSDARAVGYSLVFGG